ncbi:regulator of chromosome condensation (RCC1) repeat domain-containing protein [Hirsutella rhossiliensis]|uniref:Regulator of chromosome condensation (RCC1) repeat domain-containing protein n=1 Tax=Hirsutella rhossiliensis TaxID=111463 RepID=A0A9P8N803_9HYPO|nr:regulator of chromosome condensation (RCC1) repeat domain-containing protein [Hirsutella rhossiliensis]KAH0968227.1 regulator of chromosome condensation (RCC1) repeat domain-containing protein [Hirsutella rhossiliensis]
MVDAPPNPTHMLLFAAGFNACGQLSFDSNSDRHEPDDLFCFAKVLEAERIERPVARLSYTQVRIDGRLCIAGIGPRDSRIHSLAHFFAEAANGEVLMVQDDDVSVCDGQGRRQPGKLLVKYSCMERVRACDPLKSWPLKGAAVSTIAAFAAGFAILYQDGTVATMGDARFQDCLGRDVSDEAPADQPGIVLDLADLEEPIKHVSAGGYTIAALTESGGIYLWGMSPHRAESRKRPFLALSRVPNYIEVDDGKDVKDMAVGDLHVLALTTDGSIYALGDNRNGQTGLGKSAGHGVQDWTKVDFHVPSGQKAIAVAAGPRSSFILTAPVPA